MGEHERTMPKSFRVITKKELRQLVPYTPQHILRLEREGRFPRRIRLGENRVGWILAEVEGWIAARMAERDRPRDESGP
jgi:prophage regulatory protein